MVLIIDPQISGISGDMILSSLVNLGANKNKIINGIKKSEQYFSNSSIKKIDFQEIQKQGISAVQLDLDVEDEFKQRSGAEVKNSIKQAASTIDISDKAKSFVKSCIDTLLSSEAKIHGISKDLVYFHEASSIDTLVDIVGVAIALDDLGLFDEKIICLPVCVGSGSLSFSHGTMSNPASAILEIFKDSGLLIQGSDIKEELTTPTGACILVNLTSISTKHYPQMKINSIGYGAGQKNLQQAPDVLKLVRGLETNVDVNFVKVIETNVDDISGEILGELVERLMDCGAKDVSIFQGITKKGRPTNLISVICDDEKVDQLSEILIIETGTLGIRISTSERFVVPRSINKIKINLNGESFEISYKKSFFKGNLNFKIEFRDLKKISKIINKSIKETDLLLRKQLDSLEN